MYPTWPSKKLRESGSFLHNARFRMKNPDENACEQNKWSDRCPRRRRKQKWHDGEKIYANARMAGGKAAISRHAHRNGRSSGATSMALPKAIDKTPVPLSPVEQQWLYQYVQENPTTRKMGLLLWLELGLRIGEICGLQWGDFDLKLGTLKISRTVYRISCGNGHTKAVIQTLKTRTSRRGIPIPKYLLVIPKKLRGNANNSCPATNASPQNPAATGKALRHKMLYGSESPQFSLA